MMSWDFYDSAGGVIVAAARFAPLVTSLPAGAIDGQQVILCDSITAPTYQWLLQYVAAKATNKWIYVGGSPASSAVTASESVTGTTATTAFSDPTTPGPTFTTAVAGLYRIQFILRAAMNADYGAGAVALSEGGAAAELATALRWQPTNSGTGAETPTWTLPDRQVAASTALKMQYRAVANSGTITMTVDYRRIVVTPVALGG